MNHASVFMLALICLSGTVAKDISFDYLILAQFWPPSSCVYFEEKHQGCLIPSDVKGWTIHGFWPSRPHSEAPQSCNDSMPFDYSQIAVLGKELDLQWHFYEKGADPHYLWKHEWGKHGTCAYSLPALRGELNYFNKTLQMHSQLNITKALANSGIVPSSSRTYNWNDINKALKAFYKVEPVVVCDYDRETKDTYLDQIYLCYDKSFKLIDCYQPEIREHPWRSLSKVSYSSQCEDKDKVKYLPIRNERYAQKRVSPLIFESEKSRN